MSGDSVQRSSNESLIRLGTLMKESGISRLADLTELDRIGIPVWTAIRPLGRSLSTCQGKGMTDEEAQLSCVGEAIETWRLESMASTDYGSNVKAVDLDGCEIKLENPSLIDAISLDLRTSRIKNNSIFRNTNGVGSNWDVKLAVEHAFNEIVERKSINEWKLRSPKQCFEKLISISYLMGKNIKIDFLLNSLHAADVLITLWDLSIDSSITVILCVLGDQNPQYIPQLSEGTGCSSSPIKAIERAILEAAQSRLTLISGSRDDLSHHFYTQYHIFINKRDNPPAGIWKPCLQAKDYVISDLLSKITNNKLNPDDLLILKLNNGCNNYTTIKIHHPSLLAPTRNIYV